MIVLTGHDSATGDTVQLKTFHEEKEQKNAEQKTSSDASNTQVVVDADVTLIVCNALVCCAVVQCSLCLHDTPHDIPDLLFYLITQFA